MEAMDAPRAEDERLRILEYWWVLELFSAQPVPKPTPRGTHASDRQVLEWRPGMPLPWDSLAPPEQIGGTRRVWRHTVYLGVYDLGSTYEWLHRAFGEDGDAYEERPAGSSACAGLLIDDSGCLVPGSAVLSSALWAVARIRDPGPQDPRWMDGFDKSAEALTDAVDVFEGERRDLPGADEPPPQTGDSLHGLLQLSQSICGIEAADALATAEVRIASVAVSARRAEESATTDFLNSFFLDDLAAVRDEVCRGTVGQALQAYLTPECAVPAGARVDVVRCPAVVNAATAVGRLPKGRWPANPKHPLALSQQLAVNQALTDLGRSAGLMGVNGPPGTGKTTMLRDILAGNVVERARRLAGLERAQDAFTTVTHRWTAKEGHPRIVRQLREELTGFEMVLASANNAAVENVTTEIPARHAIDQTWRESADYFGQIATEVARGTSERRTPEHSGPPMAWGLVAARLGRKQHRSAFHNAFWFDEKDPTTSKPVQDGVPRMQTRLKNWRDGTETHPSWGHARERFTTAEQRVDTLLHERKAAQERLNQVPRLAEREHTLTVAIDAARRNLEQTDRDLDRHRPVQRRAETELTNAVEGYEQHLAAKPGALETIFTFGRAIRDWRRRLQPISMQQAEAQQRHHDNVLVGDQLRDSRQHTETAASRAEHDLARVRDAQASLRTRCARDADRYGSGYPGPAWTGDQRELHAPWLDPSLDVARSELFLAALQLHQHFLANTAGDMLNGLRAATEVVAGIYPHQLEPDKLRAAWQTFFLAVPLVSTTFASASRMFAGVGAEAIGWLLIDEAGQASPQHAVGAIWRSRRIIAVGDPLQLQPIVTIPQKARADIAAHYGVSATWIPPRASVQTLADRVATQGTTLHQGEADTWVSAPLRVHRRCDEPMFTLCNQIAYDGIMVNGVHRDADTPDIFGRPGSGAPLIAPSRWTHEPARTAGSHLQPNQVHRLERAIEYLNSHGVDNCDIIAISPFRAVADRLASLAMNHPGLHAGTIHTAQGREAPVVILVLGGDPDSPGAKAWAASTVNLVNVAASRAQRRLYVIGDRPCWAQHNYFRQLSAALD